MYSIISLKLIGPPPPPPTSLIVDLEADRHPPKKNTLVTFTTRIKKTGAILINSHQTFNLLILNDFITFSNHPALSPMLTH